VKKKLIFLVNVDWFFVSHRLPIAISAIKKGYDVYLLTKNTDKKNLIESYGITFIEIPFERSRLNILNEVKVLYKIFTSYVKIKPDVVHHITLKPILYGSIIANILKIKNVVNAISGLGYNFINKRKSLVKNIMIFLLRNFNYNKNVIFIFQNNEDLLEFKKYKIVNSINNYFIIKGSGVDLNIFKKTNLPLLRKINILFPSRMLWDKGVSELKYATELLKDKYSSKISFVLAGMIDNNNKSAVPLDYILNWQDGDYVKWVGFDNNILNLYNQCDIVILPSYREGFPKALVEASAVGRPIITTDAIGCRDCVEQGINGIKVPVTSFCELANAIIFLVDNKELMIQMGNNSRLIAEREYDINKIVDSHLLIYQRF
jgi:glycosyltransferase involved in cell wall biosynthesis